MILKRTLIYLILGIMALIFLVPFVSMTLGAFQKTQMALDPSQLLTKMPSTYNFNYILTTGSFVRWIFNSLIMTLAPVFSQIILCTITGYIFAKKQFAGKEIYFWMLMAILMIPGQLLIIPKYIMFGWFGWINTYTAMIVPELYGVMGIFLVRQFMQSIPVELEEAAYMDGAGDFSILFKVIMPLAKPAMATVGTLSFIANWNDFFTPLILLTKVNMYPLTVGLSTLLASEGNFGIEMAGAFISFIPTFLIYLMFQRYFTEGISMTGLK
jgi:multiple sugar transport system permease protein